jgi:hypothetical protein
VKAQKRSSVVPFAKRGERAAVPAAPGALRRLAKKTVDDDLTLNRSGSVLIEDLKKKERGKAPKLMDIKRSEARRRCAAPGRLPAGDHLYPAQTGRKRETGLLTRRDYKRRLRKAVRTAESRGADQEPDRVGRQACPPASAVLGRGRPPASYIQNLAKPLRRLCVWLDKPDALGPLDRVLKNPAKASELMSLRRRIPRRSRLATRVRDELYFRLAGPPLACGGAGCR